ncbi:MAG: SOS response-associated peptidase [Bacteroidales bacterium]|nr:SOS response-associated peptidase [Bacteroidales bacterium]
MCGRYILVQKLENIEKRFNVTAAFDTLLKPQYNISAGAWVPIIGSDDPHHLQLMRFGITPFWSKTDKFFINARAEGDHNSENLPHYKGAKGIIEKPAFRRPIRSQRCLVIADAFIEGTIQEKLNKPFVVYLRNKVRPFAMAGIWDEWKNPETGEIVRSFAIITTVANELLLKLPHSRMPVILTPAEERKWLDLSLPLSDMTAMLAPYGASLMNAYPISPVIKSPKAEGAKLISPIGPPVVPEDDLQVKSYLQRSGMGNPKQNFSDHLPEDEISSSD